MTAIGANARGISVGHLGKSGALRLELMGGVVTTRGERAFGIFGLHEVTGDIDIVAQGFTIATMGEKADGILGAHEGAGDIDIDIDIQGSDIAARGDIADGMALSD